MAEAIDEGMRAIKALTGLNAAVMRMRTAARKKDPTATSMVIPVVVAIRAAPGVDQAATMGMRWRTLRIAVVTAVARHSADTHDDVCSGLAPTALAASRMMATEPPNPTMMATKAEMTTDGRISSHYIGSNIKDWMLFMLIVNDQNR